MASTQKLNGWFELKGQRHPIICELTNEIDVSRKGTRSMGWSGTFDLTEDKALPQLTIGEREVKLILEDGRQGTILIGSTNFHSGDFTVQGDFEYTKDE